jgi:hypothetical protein
MTSLTIDHFYKLKRAFEAKWAAAGLTWKIPLKSPIFFFEGENPATPHHARVTKAGKIYDYIWHKYFDTLEEWHADVVASGLSVPLSAIRFGRAGILALTPVEIEHTLYWDMKRPLTGKPADPAPAAAAAAAPAPAPAPAPAAGGAGAGAGTAVDIPVDESTTVSCLARHYQTRQAAFKRRSDEEVAVAILLLGRWLQASAVTEWSLDVERQLTDAGLADGAPIVMALLTLRSS